VFSEDVGELGSTGYSFGACFLRDMDRSLRGSACAPRALIDTFFLKHCESARGSCQPCPVWYSVRR